MRLRAHLRPTKSMGLQEDLGSANNGQCSSLCVIRAKIKFRNIHMPQRHSHPCPFTLYSLLFASLFSFSVLVKMKSSRRPRIFSSAATAAAAATTVLYTFQNDHSASEPNSKITEIPIVSAPDGQPTSKPIPITVHLPAQPQSRESSATVKIQSAYRSHVVRTLVRKISAVNSEANYWQRIIQRQA